MVPEQLSVPVLGPFAALDHVFLVEVVEGDPAVLDGLLAALAAPGATATTRYRVGVPADGDQRSWLEVDGRRLERDEATSVHSLLVAVAGLAAVDLVEAPILHGCLVEHGGVGVLVAGRSGSGKSTFTARLLQGGAALVTEDVTVLRADGSVRPYPRPLGLSGDSLEVLGLPVPPDDCGCGCMEHPFHPAALGGRVADRGRIDVVVLCDRTTTGAGEVTLPALLARLFDEASLGNVADADHLEQVAAVLAGARLLELGTADLDGAVAELDRWIGRAAGAPVAVAAEQLGGASVLYLDGEALVHVEDHVHHLDAAATAVWVLHLDGLSTEQIAEELGGPLDAVAATLARLRELELPAPTP